MSERTEVVPDLLPARLTASHAQIVELALELYQRLATETARAQVTERKCAAQLEELQRAKNRTISDQAVERFEFQRLLERILPALEAAGLADVIKVLRLYARSWDASLQRAQIEVEDLTGRLLTDELVELIEVESAIPDPAVHASVVRKTIRPLVKIDGHVTGLAKVNTSVPVKSE
jgi:hypothetical protein